jgi:PhoPQ-activated pathogenicity-related protein
LGYYNRRAIASRSPSPSNRRAIVSRSPRNRLSIAAQSFSDRRAISLQNHRAIVDRSPRNRCQFFYVALNLFLMHQIQGEEYIIRGHVDKRGWTGYVLNMTSQRWLTDADFSATSDGGSLWWHYLVVIVPDNELKYANNATLWITGGSVKSGKPSNTDEDIVLAAALATSVGTVTGALFGVPNEHLTFSSDPIQQSRTEDAIIAFTWDHFLKDPSDPTWLVRFPMVKASVRAMDAVKEFMVAKVGNAITMTMMLDF